MATSDRKAEAAYTNYWRCMRNPNGTRLPTWADLPDNLKTQWGQPPLASWVNLKATR